MTDIDLVTPICETLTARKQALTDQFHATAPIRHFVADGLLPDTLARRIYDSFPESGRLKCLRSLREYKLVGADMDAYDPIVSGILFAFHDPRVCTLMRDITGKADFRPDPHLYAGGLSAMTDGHFLNPHLDNSHDKDRALWRVANALFYVSPGWRPEHGGSLELWPEGPRGRRTVIPALFNRLVLMETHDRSWHSVDRIRSDRRRCCVSNYYFSSVPSRESQVFTVTSFRGRPEQRLRDSVLRADNAVRQIIRNVVGNRIFKNFHEYPREK